MYLQETPACMRTDMLYGVRFASDASWKNSLQDGYINWRREEEKRLIKKTENAVTLLGQSFGYTPEQAKEILDERLPDRNKLPDFSEVKDFLKEDGCKHYYITSMALTMCQQIRIKEPFDLEWLLPMKDGKKQFNFGNNLLRYNKTGSHIIALMSTLDPKEGPHPISTFWTIDLSKKRNAETEVTNDHEEAPSAQILKEDFNDDSRKLLVQMITLIELAEIQEVFIAPGRKSGTRKSELNLKNDSRFAITVVSTTWNKIIRTDGFSVDGHLRNQAYGPGKKL